MKLPKNKKCWTRTEDANAIYGLEGCKPKPMVSKDYFYLGHKFIYLKYISYDGYEFIIKCKKTKISIKLFESNKFDKLKGFILENNIRNEVYIDGKKGTEV